MQLRAHSAAARWGATSSRLVRPQSGRSFPFDQRLTRPLRRVCREFVRRRRAYCVPDYVRAALGLDSREKQLGRSSWGSSRPRTVAEGTDLASRSALALRLWKEAHDPRGTMVEGYLASRDLTLSRTLRRSHSLPSDAKV